MSLFQELDFAQGGIRLEANKNNFDFCKLIPRMQYTIKTRFCNQCKPNGTMLPCSSDCQICPHVRVEALDVNPMIKENETVDLCNLCLGFIVYKYEHDGIEYEDYANDFLHYVIENKCYKISNQTSRGPNGEPIMKTVYRR
jgi:hypothetical protein